MGKTPIASSFRAISRNVFRDEFGDAVGDIRLYETRRSDDGSFQGACAMNDADEDE
jgi:hypothetical protein